MGHNSKMPQLGVFLLEALVVLLLGYAGTANGKRFSKIFTFGDSFADIGNRDPNNPTQTAIGRVNQPWLIPYGQSGGAPTGRFSSGIIFSDYLANYVGLHPRPYKVYPPGRPGTTIQDGINFAVGGAGVFDNLGFTKTGDQIAQLQPFLTNGTYAATVYNESLIVFTISGNDYNNYVRNNFLTLPAIFLFANQVVNQVIADLTTLYNLGFRNFAVTLLPPVGCLPNFSQYVSFLACIDTANDLSAKHNALLTAQLKSDSSVLPGANVVILDTTAAFQTAFTSPQFPKKLKPCCKGFGLTPKGIAALCGDTDWFGNPQYTVCSASNTDSYFFWDEFHPTQAGWGFIFSLFLQPSYADGTSLVNFLA